MSERIIWFTAGLHGLGWRWPWDKRWRRIKPPSEPVLFSERYGFSTVVRLPFGWRYVRREPGQHRAEGQP